MFAEQYFRQGTKKLSKLGLVPAKVWGHMAFGLNPTERLKLRRQIAQVAGKKRSTSLSIFLEVNEIEVQHAHACDCGNDLLACAVLANRKEK